MGEQGKQGKEGLKVGCEDVERITTCMVFLSKINVCEIVHACKWICMNPCTCAPFCRETEGRMVFKEFLGLEATR